MADLIRAKQVYATIIKALDSDNLKYTKDDNELRIDISFTTNDLDVKLIFSVDEDRDLIRLLSFLPGTFPENKRIEGAVATTVANHNMVDGSFDFDINDGDIVFKMANSYRSGTVTTDCVLYMLRVALGTVDRYNDRFFALSTGMITLQDFIAKEN